MNFFQGHDLVAAPQQLDPSFVKAAILRHIPADPLLN
jgi:hypothetical protein